MKMKKIILISSLLIAVTLITSCTKGSKDQQGNGLTIAVEQSDNPVLSFKDVTEKFVELVLHEPDSDPLGTVNKVLVSESKIFVLDSYKSKSLFVFDSKGVFQHKIGGMGQADGEFINPDDFAVDNRHNEVIILDRNKQQLLFYNMTGAYLRKIYLGKYVNSFTLYGTDKILLDRGNIAGNDTGMALEVIQRDNGEKLVSFFPVEDYKKDLTFSPMIPLFHYDDSEVLYLPSMSNEVYYIENDTAYTKYRFDFAGKWASNDYLKSVSNTSPTDILKKIFDDNYVLFPNILETKKYVYLDYYSDLETKYHAYYDKTTGKFHPFEIGREFAGDFSVVGISNDSFITATSTEEGNTGLLFFSFK